MKLRVVVLGAGFGGSELSTILSETIGEQIDLTLIDQNDSFSLAFQNSMWHLAANYLMR